MAFAGGLAYSFENYEIRGNNNHGTFWEVMQDTIRTFQNDCRLIRPKKFGYKTSKFEEIELVEVTNLNRKSAEVEIVFAPSTTIPSVHKENYF